MFSPDALAIDAGKATRTIEDSLRVIVLEDLRRRGIVVGLSGGVDSSVVAALAVRALGRENVLGLLMPERDTSGDAERLGELVAKSLGVRTVREDLTAALVGLGCYARQEDAIRAVFPEFAEGFRFKVTLPPLLERDRLNVSRLVIESPSGETKTARMSADSYRKLIAATNFKQRLRKTLEYYHADALGYAVAGTPNRLEFDQGFFVKQGDGAADVKPIAHLYKTQVYALAEHLEVPAEVRRRRPTTDTFSMAQTQEEFYFALPYETMDLCLCARDQGVPSEEAAAALGLTAEQVTRVYRDIDAKRRAARYLHSPPLFAQRSAAEPR